MLPAAGCLDWACAGSAATRIAKRATELAIGAILLPVTRDGGAVRRKFGVPVEIGEEVGQTCHGDDGNAVVTLHLLHGGQLPLTAFLTVEGDEDAGRRGAGGT